MVLSRRSVVSGSLALPFAGPSVARAQQWPTKTIRMICPYAPGASGNLVTEDLVLMLNAMGYQTGIDLEKLLKVRAILADALPGEPLYGFTPDAGVMMDYQERIAR